MSKTADIALPQLDCHTGDGRKIRRSKAGPRRAVVLVLVHVVFAIHVALWLIMGSTISPVEPSESMQTLELGLVNAGFVFFLLAIISTLIFGRYFCGWGCHVVALQDLCGWGMKKLGVHPKPFRSRLLVFAPLALGLYMFVWPTFKRVALKPALEAMNLSLPVWIKDVPELHGFQAHFIVEDFWATFPPWWVAVPFLLICGFAAVYFLGAKGFCTYGCPYGGLFAPADTVAPGRIRVTDDCEQCGHCTAVCTSNVRVHDEVREFGMVVDPGCMKCMDCVNVCPKDALYFGFGKPSLGSKRLPDAEVRKRPRYDLTRFEEIVVAALFVVFFMSFRQMFGLVPMLMAAGMAGIAAFLAFKLWSLVLRPNVRLQNLVLKRKGRLTLPGAVVGLIALVTVLSGFWSGAVNALRTGASWAHDSIVTPASVAMRSDYVASDEDRARAERVVRSLSLVRTPDEGGFGWGVGPEELRQLAFAHLILGDYESAERDIREIIDTGRPGDPLMIHLGRIMQRNGRSLADIRSVYERAIDRTPGLHATRAEVSGMLLAETRDASRALRVWDGVLESEDVEPTAQLMALRTFVRFGDQQRAQGLAERIDADTLAPEGAVEFAGVLLSLRQTDRATRVLDDAIGRADTPAQKLAASELLLSLARDDDVLAIVREIYEASDDASTLLRASALAARAGDRRLATEMLADAQDAPDTDPMTLVQLGSAWLQLADPTRARAAFESARAACEHEPWWTCSSVGLAMIQLGSSLGGQGRELIDSGLAILRQSAEQHPSIPGPHADLAQGLFATGSVDQAVEAMKRAIEIDPDNPALRSRMDDLLDAIGRSGDEEKLPKGSG